MRPSVAHVAWVLGTLLGAGAMPLPAQAILEVDQATGRATLRMADSAAPINVRSGAALRMRWPATIRVRVVNGNTAVYRYSAETRDAPPPSEPVTGRVGEFLKQFRPYLPEVALAVAGPASGGRPRGAGSLVYHSLLPVSPPDEASDVVREAWDAGRGAEYALAAVDDRVYGRRGLQESMVFVLTTLEAMRGGGSVESLSRDLSDSLALPVKGCAPAAGPERLPLTSELLVALQTLLRARNSLTTATALASPELAGAASQRALRDSLLRITTLADSATAHFESIVAAAYDFERVALPVAHACASWNSRPIPFTEMERRMVTVKMEPRSEPELARVARGSSTFSLTVLSTPLVVTSLGASLMVAPDASFPTYATRSASGGVEIFENGVRDVRFTWGVTFGAGWRVSSGLAAHGVRFWLPEITFNPQNDVRALGIGGALSLGMLKLGAGALWARHSQLLGQAVGDVIPTKDHLRVADAYGRRKFYISISVFDVPPFVYSAPK